MVVGGILRGILVSFTNLEGMELDERKRAFDGSMGEPPVPFGGQPKRSRPEDSMGVVRDDPMKATTRLLLNKTQFSRVIGKGGATIALVRTTTGVYMKGSDIDEEYRLVVLNGTIDQVLSAFDMVTEALCSGDSASLVPRSADMLVLNLLLEHNKAGKAVGAKGAMIQAIKLKSGAMSIRIEKEPLEIHGVPLRKLAIEGSLNSVRRAHFLVQELYMEPGSMMNSSAYSNLAQIGAASESSPSYGHRPGYSGAPGGFDPVLGSGQLESGQLHHSVQVPFPTLTNYGVQQETVRQLTDMKAYLWRHFGLDLTISREMPSTSPVSHTLGGGIQLGMQRLQESQPYGSPYQAGLQSRQLLSGMLRTGSESAPNGSRRPSHTSGPMDVSFSVPKSCVGAVIGKGGQNLKDLQTEHGVRVYIEKDDIGGKRTVVLSFVGGENVTLPGQEALLRCQQHIEAVVADQLAKLKQAEGQFPGEANTE